MDTVRILQVGDVHFDDAQSAARDIDASDDGISQQVLDAIGAHPFQCVVKQMVGLFPEVDAVLFCGDLTTYGNLDVYRESVGYLEQTFAITTEDFWPTQSVHVVPGNHDVDRTLIDTSDTRDLREKFQPLAQAWSDNSAPILKPAEIRTSTVRDGTAAATIFSLNSCIGCGEHREQGLSDAVRAEFQHRADEGDADAAATLFEQLDAPMFVEDDVASTVQAIRALEDAAVPVLLAHHNLLPQRQPRLQVYTEMLNAGAVRARFAGCDRPVLYLHGHIHDDPVEVVEQFHPGEGKLVSVSAPAISDGFNVLEITSGHRGFPVGVTITRWRYAGSGDVVANPPIRIPLRRPTDEGHAATASVLRVLDDLQYTRWSNFLEAFRAVDGDSYTDDDVADAVREAHWAGLLEVEAYADQPARWILRRRLP